MLLLIAALFALFLFVGQPVAFALGLAAIPVFILTGTMPPSVAVQKMVSATQSFPLLAVPFFILAGNLMNVTGVTERLVRFARLLVLAIRMMDGDEEAARRWMSAKLPALGNETPLEVAATEAGARRVEDVISGLSYGMFS